MFTHTSTPVHAHVVPLRLSNKLTLVYNIPSIVPVKSNPQQQSIFNCNYPERQMVLFWPHFKMCHSLHSFNPNSRPAPPELIHPHLNTSVFSLPPPCALASLLQVCAARRCPERTGTQAHGVSVCTEQISDFLWSCQPGLAGEQLWSPISLPRPLPERWTSSKCHQAVNAPFHCCWASSSLRGSVSGHTVRFQSCAITINISYLHPAIQQCVQWTGQRHKNKKAAWIPRRACGIRMEQIHQFFPPYYKHLFAHFYRFHF